MATAERNTLAASRNIVDRLQAQVTGVNTIADISRVAGVSSLDSYLDAIFVTDGGSTYSPGNGRTVQVELQNWLISIVVKKRSDPAGDDIPDWAAGEIKVQVEEALIGWAPSPIYQALEFVRREPAEYSHSFVDYTMLLQARVAVGSR